MSSPGKSPSGSPSFRLTFTRKRRSGVHYGAYDPTLAARKSFPRDSDGFEPLEAYFNSEDRETSSDEEFLEENNSVVKTYQAKRNKKNLSRTPKQRKTVTSSSKRNPHSSRAEVSMPKSPLRVSQSQTPTVSGTPPLTRSKAVTATTGSSRSKNKEMSESIQPTLTPARLSFNSPSLSPLPIASPPPPPASPPNVDDTEATPSVSVEPALTVSPLNTVKKPRKKRKRITCPSTRPKSRRSSITMIQRRTNVTPGVRRSKRPRINKLPPGGYVQYRRNEALYIVNPISSPSPRKRPTKTPRDEDDCYVQFEDTDDPESIMDFHVLYPCSNGQLTNIDGNDLKPGDDIIINRVFGTKDLQVGELELTKGAEKPLVKNGDCHMLFKVTKGKVLLVLGENEIEASAHELISIPPCAAYQLINCSNRASAKLDYIVFHSKQ